MESPKSAEPSREDQSRQPANLLSKKGAIFGLLARFGVMHLASQGPILVIGATGNQGRQVVRALLDAGRTVHAFTRNPSSPRAQALQRYGAHLVQGDLADRGSLIEAIHLAAGVFSVQNFWELGMNQEVRLGSNVIRTATEAGHRPHLVYSSGLGAERPQHVEAIDGKAILEQHLRNSGLPYTILQPGLFMDDFRGASLPFARPIQRLLRRHRPLVGRLFLATLRAVMPKNHPIPLTSLHDLGCMAAWAFEHPRRAQDQTYRIIGSADTAETLCLTWEQRMRASIPYVPAPKWGIRLVHPQMAALLAWLGRYEAIPSELPIALQSYDAWLLASAQHPC